MQWIRKQCTPLRVFSSVALLLLIVLVPLLGTFWIQKNVQAHSAALSGLPRVNSASSMFGPTAGPHAQRIRPTSVIPGRRFPGLAGHAARRAGRNVLSAHIVHSNSAFVPNVVVSSDTTAPPFGPLPRNGPQAAIDPTNPNRLVVVYNDYTPNGQGGSSTAGYTISTDGGTSWAAPQVIHGLLKIDGGPYDGAADPGIAFDASGNAYLPVTTFNNDDWATAIYVAKMSATSSQFDAPLKVVSFNDTHRVVEYARLAINPSDNALYLTFNALSASPQAPNATLAAAWTSQLFFTRSTDGGQTWTSPVAIGMGPQDYWGVPVVGSNNSLYVFYSGALGLEMLQSSDGGQTWSSIRSLQSMSTVGEQRLLNEVYSNPGPSAVADPGDGTLYVVYDGGKVILSTDNGVHWTQPLDVLGSRFVPAFLASISVDPMSHVVSVGGYSSAGDASQNTFNYFYAQSADGGNHFSSPVLVSTNASLPPAPAFGSIGRASSMVSSGHFAHLFWTDTNGTGGNEQIMSAAVDVSQPMTGALQNSWDSAQTLPPWGLIFTSPGTQNIGVANYGQGGIGDVSVSTSDESWLSASSSGGPCPCVVTVSVTAGSSNQSGFITINSSGGMNNSITIPVQLLVNSPNPAFSLSGTSLSFSTPQGLDPAPQAIQVSSLSATGDNLQISTGNDVALSIFSPTGTQNANLSPGMPSGFIVQIDTAGLSAGSSDHQVVVSDGTTSLTVNISLAITPAPARLDDPGSTLSFTWHQQDAIVPQAQLLTLHNSGGSTLHWQATTDVAWLSLGAPGALRAHRAANGTLAPDQLQQLGVTVNVAGLPMGTATGHIILGGDAQALNLPALTTVYLVISPPGSQISTTWYFAEGYVSANFTEFLTLENPNSQPANVSVTYLTQPVGQAPRAPFVLSYIVNPDTRYTVLINSQPGIVQNDQVSLVVNSDVPVVAERPIYFKFTLLSPNPSGGTDELGATHQGTLFFFPFVQFGNDQQINSPTYGTSYVTYLTVLNQNNAPVNVAITYKGAGSLYTVTHQVDANTRGTVSLAGDFPLASGANNNSYLYAESLMVNTDLPVVVELSSYFTIPNNTTHIAFASGTDEIGAASPQLNWDFAEGYTGSNTSQFLTYLDLANAGNTPATVTLTLAVTNGATSLPAVTKQYSVGPQSSISVWLNQLVCPPSALYCGYAVGAHVASTQPIVVDRQMYFNYSGKIPGSTAVVGSSGSQAVYYFAEGYTGTGFNEYLTIVNPATNASSETITIRYLLQNGSSKTIVLPEALQPGQRWTELVNHDIGSNQSVSAVVSTTSGTIIVERPMYFNFHSQASGASDVIGYSPGN
jgi:hypothetical protein